MKPEASFRSWLRGFALATAGCYSSPTRFVDWVAQDATAFDELHCETSYEFRSALDTIVDELSGKASPSDPARRRLLVDDLQRIRQTSYDIPEEWGRPTACEDAVPVLLGAVTRLGVEDAAVDGWWTFRVVDSFPAPYDNQTFWAMSFDAMDREWYGIDPGIALLRSELVPVYSLVLLAHELTHVVIGRVPTERLANGFEEGLADLWGALVLAESGILPWDIVGACLFNSRSHFQAEQLPQIYAESFRTLLAVTEAFGPEMIIELVAESARQGREFVKTLEALVAVGNWDVLAEWISERSSPMSLRYRDEFRVNARSILGKPVSMIVSPVAYEIARLAEVGDTVSALAERIGYSIDETRDGLRELEHRVYLVVVKDGTIMSAEGRELVTSRVLRYDAVERNSEE